MVRVPRMQEGQRLSGGQASPFQDSRQARIRGDSISQLGRGVSDLANMFKRLDNARKSTAIGAAKYEAKRRYQDLQDRIERSEGDGVRDKEFFDSESREILNQLQEQLGEKYSGKYGAEIKQAIRDVEIGYRGRTMESSLNRFKESVKQEVVEANSIASGLAFQEPSDIENIAIDHESQLRGALEALELEPSRIDLEVRNARKSLANSALDGFLNQGNYAGARALVTSSEFSEFYDPEQQRQELDRIENTQIRHENIYWGREDRKRAEEERERKRIADEKTADFATRILMAEESGDVLLMSETRKEAIEAFRDMDIDGTQVNRILGDHVKGYKRIDAQSSLTIADLAFQSETVGDIQAARSKVLEKMRNERLMPESAERWLRYLNGMEERIQQDPSFARRRKIFKDRLDLFVTPLGIIENMEIRFEDDAARSHITRTVQVKTDYELAVEGGMDPLEAYVHTIKEHYQGVDSLEPFAGYRERSIKTEEDLDAFRLWGEARLTKGTRRWEQYKLHMYEARMAIKRDEMISQNEKMVNLLDNKVGLDTGRSLINDLDSLMETDTEGTMPFIFRDSRPPIPMRGN